MFTWYTFKFFLVFAPATHMLFSDRNRCFPFERETLIRFLSCVDAGAKDAEVTSYLPL